MGKAMLDKETSWVAASGYFDRSVQLATSRQMSPVELFTITATLKSLNQTKLAADLYKIWIAYNGDNELVGIIYFNYGTALNEAGDKAGAINAFREGIRLKPDFYSSYINLGRVLEDVGLAGDAVNQWLDLVKNLPMVNADTVKHKLVALHQIGRVLESNFNDAAAEDALKQSLDIHVEQDEIIQHWVALRQRQCKWPAIAGWDVEKKRKVVAGISPLSLANLTDDPMFQLANAFRYNKQSIGFCPLPPIDHKSHRATHERLRIGYVSSDLREHAVGFAMTDVFETHDRERFEIFAYYCGIERDDAIKQRTKDAAEHWFDISAISDEEAAQKIRDDEIDILIDLNGYTKSARTRVFAMRPAPVAVNWFGFPGTMGSPYHHYIIADPVIIPPEQERFYSEKVLRLSCYQPNDRKRLVAPDTPTRAEMGLPDEAFVFCSFNGSQKLTQLTFERWLSILEQVQDSVLWLLSSTPDTDESLRRRAREKGIAAERLIFAGKLANPFHLARYPLADLFLDSFPYGAHTTGADALWMGVPVLTLKGRSFASRVCASLLTAAGIPELIADSGDDYVRLAVELAQHRDQLDMLKQRLIASRDICRLFDMRSLVADLEALYVGMWRDFETEQLPVPNLRNLLTYHEIALDLDHEKIELLDDEEYAALYREKLMHWHATYPIEPDIRLWTEEGSAR